jgi:phenylacetate-coenzyme A ligase PaaK-like adenylate-forming protein
MSERHDLTDVMQWPVYGLDPAIKSSLLLDELNALTTHHANGCESYQDILKKLWVRCEAKDLKDIPFLPVRLFKHERLLSVPTEDVVKTMTSSGTSGQSVSQIFLDKKTAAMQIKVLSKIMANFVGTQRLPMLVIDCRATVSDRLRFSARTAGILGFSMFGRDVVYALDDDMTLNIDRVQQFLDKYAEQPLLIFGFTFMIWKHLVESLQMSHSTLNLDQGILIHGGGWKQLEDQAVSAEEFKSQLKSVTGISRVHNYYGMVEQTGSIFMECEQGFLHASAWADVLVRDPLDFKVLPLGQSGLIQLLSLIPHSYPGHSLLSEDEGVIGGLDGCACGRRGTFFKVLGRIQQAEKRGCSDTYTR